VSANNPQLYLRLSNGEIPLCHTRLGHAIIYNVRGVHPSCHLDAFSARMRVDLTQLIVHLIEATRVLRFLLSLLGTLPSTSQREDQESAQTHTDHTTNDNASDGAAAQR